VRENCSRTQSDEWNFPRACTTSWAGKTRREELIKGSGGVAKKQMIWIYNSFQIDSKSPRWKGLRAGDPKEVRYILIGLS